MPLGAVDWGYIGKSSVSGDDYGCWDVGWGVPSRKPKGW